MKILSVILVTLWVSVGLFAQQPFTVLTKSGVNMRKGPGTQFEKVGYLPFGSIVKTELPEGAPMHFDGFGNYKAETIEEIAGYWIKVTHENTTGYIFSGFGLVGEWVDQQKDEDSGYMMIAPRDYCNAIKYDPAYNWYGICDVNGALTIKKVKVQLVINQHFGHEYEVNAEAESDQDMREDDNIDYYGFSIDTDLSSEVLLIIGTKTPIDLSKIQSTFAFQPKFKRPKHPSSYHSFTDAIYIPKGESYSTKLNNRTFTFTAGSEMIVSTYNNQEFPHYTLKLIAKDNSQTKSYTFSGNWVEGYLLDETANHQTPQLVWTGDLNGDGGLDALFFAGSEFDSCGFSEHYHLFVSQPTGSRNLMENVANYYNDFCGYR